mmetsp:Transcript_35912/g.64222  ORF Transcript_35912/g.64222 Transcript_35912/m.64222 type:complete len:92 (+) Transcript_35912:1438-1713(+)
MIKHHHGYAVTITRTRKKSQNEHVHTHMVKWVHTHTHTRMSTSLGEYNKHADMVQLTESSAMSVQLPFFFMLARLTLNVCSTSLLWLLSPI